MSRLIIEYTKKGNQAYKIQTFLKKKKKKKKSVKLLRLRLHLALTCNLYPDVVHIHIEKTSVKRFWSECYPISVACSRGSRGRIMIVQGRL